VRRALSYGMLAARRRARILVLPAVTVATGAFLVVLVIALMPAVREQGEALGNADGVGRVAVAIAVFVLLVGALEVAITATRSLVARTREIGVLSSFGVPPRAVVLGLLVEPVVTAAAGGAAGALLGAAACLLGSAAGWVEATVTAAAVTRGALTAAGVSTVAAALASAAPAVRAARRPPLSSLTS
jgi:ABC-type antimicrobial peptide transport system permease subunit